jgi:hypothetical protein
MWAAVIVIVGLGAVEKAPCLSDERAGTISARAMCYSDMPVLYTERGLNLPFSWFGGEDPHFQSIEYPPITVLAMEADASITHGIRGESPDGAMFYWVSAATLAGLGALAIGGLCWLLGPDRSFRLLVLTAPLVIATAFINWDLLPCLLVVGALAAWRAGHLTLTGVCLGLGAAAKLYPLLLLGGIAVLAIRQRNLRPAVVTMATAAVAWTVVNLPFYLLHPAAWRAFWHFNSTRPADFGSPWYALHLLGLGIQTPIINDLYLAWMVAVCVGVLVLALKAPVVPSMESLGLLLTTAFVVMNKVNSPQYVLWLLPLMALATTRWRLLAMWSVAELVYYLVVWQYLTYGQWWITPLYIASLLARTAAEAAVAWSVLMDLTGRRPDGRVAKVAPPEMAALAEASAR